MNATRVLQYLFAAVDHARNATQRVQAMVRAAVAAFLARVAIAKAAA